MVSPHYNWAREAWMNLSLSIYSMIDISIFLNIYLNSLINCWKYILLTIEIESSTYILIIYLLDLISIVEII